MNGFHWEPHCDCLLADPSRIRCPYSHSRVQSHWGAGRGSACEGVFYLTTYSSIHNLSSLSRRNPRSNGRRRVDHCRVLFVLGLIGARRNAKVRPCKRISWDLSLQRQSRDGKGARRTATPGCRTARRSRRSRPTPHPSRNPGFVRLRTEGTGRDGL
jgi:hypothetical protein